MLSDGRVISDTSASIVSYILHCLSPYGRVCKIYEKYTTQQMSEIIRVRNTSSWILFYVSLQIINYASKFLFAVESISLIRFN